MKISNIVTAESLTARINAVAGSERAKKEYIQTFLNTVDYINSLPSNAKVIELNGITVPLNLVDFPSNLKDLISISEVTYDGTLETTTVINFDAPTTTEFFSLEEMTNFCSKLKAWTRLDIQPISVLDCRSVVALPDVLNRIAIDDNKHVPVHYNSGLPLLSTIVFTKPEYAGLHVGVAVKMWLKQVIEG